MGNAKEKDLKLELLVSTVNRTSLDFLSHLFPFDDYLNHSILVVNQTQSAKPLESSYPNIRVINNNDIGLAKSRNTAIKNAKGTFCLFVDDDVKFKKDFNVIILDAFKTNPKSSIITFMLEDFEGEIFRNYTKVKHHNLETIKEVNSVVIAFNRNSILKNNHLFDTNFGLGATFETADEYIFMREALKLNLITLFEPKIILSHPKISSGQANGSDRLVFARSALYYKYSGVLSYLKLCKYLYLINKSGEIKTNLILTKFKVGLKGIKAYKAILKTKVKA